MRTIAIVDDIIYCYLYNGSIYYNREGEETLKKLSWRVKESNWQAGRGLKAGFKGRGFISGYKGTIWLTHLNERGGVRSLTTLHSYGNKWVTDQIVAGENENIVVTLFDDMIIAHYYSFDNKKLMRTVKFKIPVLPDGRSKAESPEIMDFIQCADGPVYIVISFIEWRKVGWRGVTRMNSRLLILKLTPFGSIEEFASCDLVKKDIGPIRMLKFFGEAYEGGRYLMLVGAVGDPYNSVKITFFCFDQVEKTISVAKRLDIKISMGDVYDGKRIWGGVYCVNQFGILHGIELKKDD